MIRLREALSGSVPFAQAHKEVQGLSLQGADPALAVIYYCLAGNVALQAGRPLEAGSLLGRAEALLSRATPPEIAALVSAQKAGLCAARGDSRGAEAMVTQAWRSLRKGSPRYWRHLFDVAIQLANHGRGAEVEDLVDQAAAVDDGRYRGLAASVRLANCAETGRVAEGRAALAVLRQSPELVSFHQTVIVRVELMLDLMDRLPAGLPAELPPWAAVLAALLARRPEGALRLVQAQVRESPIRATAGFLLDSFNLVRCELSCGHGEAARRIIGMRREVGNLHYLDDFFLARAELLAGRREEAARRFAEALEACRRYRAEGRLEFELRMSCELSPADVLVLMSAAPPRAGARPSPPEPAAEPAGVPRGAGSLIGRSESARSVRRLILQFAPLPAPVLITGETGTGKELVARALHEESPRRAEPFVAVNCGAITEGLLESELFGHERGAFTGAERAHRGLFEEAGAGTVLLDEIGEMPPRLQVALLRVLETGEIRPVGSAAARRIGCRIVAATNAALEALTEKGLFRKDLLYRLRRLEIHLPPLADRREDILPLADHFLREGRSGAGRPEMSAELKELLLRRDWPGNVRELRNAIERLRLLNSDKLAYGVADLEAEAESGAVRAPESAPPPAAPDRPAAELEGRSQLRRRERLRELFRQHRRLTRAEAMRVLGISQATATRDFQALCAEGLVEKVRPTPAPRTHYFQLKTCPPGTASNS